MPFLTYNGYREDQSSGAATDSLIDAPLGAASSARFVVAALAFAKLSGATETVTIAGQSAPRIPGTISQFGTSALFCGLYGVALASGTVGNVVMTVNSSTCSLVFAAMYSLYGLSSTSPRAAAISSANPLPLSLNVPSGGCAIGFVHINKSTTIGWSGLVEDVDFSSPASTFSAASINRSVEATPLSVTATPVNGVPNCGCAASFR